MIANTIQSIKTHLGEAYSALEEKEAIIPQNKNMTNLPETINSIPKKVFNPRYINESRTTSWFQQYQGISLVEETSSMNVENFKSIYALFYSCPNLEEVNIDDWNVGNIQSMGRLFGNCPKLKRLNLSKWNTSNVTSMDEMFDKCSELELIGYENWNVSNLAGASKMFNSNQKLINGNFGNWHLDNIRSMMSMFNNCANLRKIDISNFYNSDTSVNPDTTYMFSNCSNLEVIIIDNPRVFNISATNTFQNSSIANGTGFVYVPDDLVDTYKSTTNWTTYANQIKGLSELPEGV